MSEMLTLTVIVATVALYTGNITGLVFGFASSLLGNPLVIAIAGIVIAALIVIAAFVFLRSGKKKAANSTPAGGMTDWQRQPQQGAPGAMNAWNQQGMSADNAWAQPGQQQANAWGTQAPSGSWDAQQQQANAWGAQNPAQQQPGAWGAQNPAQQQQGWGTQVPAAQQQQSGWGAQNAAQPQSGWGTQTPAPQQQGGWGTQTPAPQQQQPTWGTPGSGFGQQPQPGAWGNQGAQLAGMDAAGRNAQAWDQTAAPSSQDQWAQPQSAQAWGAPGNAAAQQMPAGQQNNPTAYGSGSGQSWGQPAQAADAWGQPQSMPAQQSMPQAQQGAWAQTYQPQVPSSPQSQPGNTAFPSWQQPGPGVGQPGFASPSPFGGEDGDRTMLRNTGAQTQNRMGIVRIEEGKEPGRVYEIRKDSLSIGRSRESDVFLEDLAVSRLHASIINMGNGNYALRDEGSANGTKVNGQTVNKYQPFNLNEGDKIQLGQTVLVFAKR